MAKPSTHINWTDGAASKIQAPTAGRQLTGYVAGDRPPAKEHNWLFHYIDLWNKYFETTTDAIVSQLLNYDAIVGADPGATHPTLQDAINAASAGWRILVLDDETINTRISVNVSSVEIDCKPTVTFTKGADTVGIEISGARVKFRGGRFVGFTVGGDKAFNLIAGADYCKLSDQTFTLNTDTEIDDSAVAAGKKPAVYGQHTEV